MRSVEFKFRGVALGSLGFSEEDIESIQNEVDKNNTVGITVVGMRAGQLRAICEGVLEINPTLELLGLEDDTLVFFGPDSV